MSNLHPIFAQALRPWMPALPAQVTDTPADELLLCSNCNGSGEGRYEGYTCVACHGAGEVRADAQ